MMAGSFGTTALTGDGGKNFTIQKGEQGEKLKNLAQVVEEDSRPSNHNETNR